MTDLEKRKNECLANQKLQYQTVFDEIQKTIYAHMVPKSVNEYNFKITNEYKKHNLSLKSQLQKAKSDLEKLQSDYGSRKVSDALKIDKLEARMKILEAENSELLNVKNELKELQSEIGLKIDVFEAGMKTLEAEKNTLEVKLDEVSLKLKLKTHEYDSLLKSKQTDCRVKLVFKSNETDKTSIGTQTIKEEPKEIGVVNLPASLSSQPKDPPVKSGTKRTSSTVEDRKIVKAKRMKTEASNTTSRMSGQSIGKNEKISCSSCLDDWGLNVQKNFGGDPERPGVPDPIHAIASFTSIDKYKTHAVNIHQYMPAMILSREKLEKFVDNDRFKNSGMTKSQIFEIYKAYRADWGSILPS